MEVKQYIKTVNIQKIWYEIDFNNIIIKKYTQNKYKCNDIDKEINKFSLNNYCLKFSDKEGVVMSNSKNSNKEVYIFNTGSVKMMNIETSKINSKDMENIIKQFEIEGYELVN
jgi:hypothetical protein